MKESSGKKVMIVKKSLTWGFQHDPGEGYQQPTNFAQRCYTSQHYIVLLYYITGCPVRAIVDSGKVLL